MEETWNLADIYSSDEAWREDFDATRALARKLPGYAGRLGESAKTLYEFVELEQKVGEHLNNLGNYAFRKGDQDTRVAENQAMDAQVQQTSGETDYAESAVQTSGEPGCAVSEVQQTSGEPETMLPAQDSLYVDLPLDAEGYPVE